MSDRPARPRAPTWIDVLATLAVIALVIVGTSQVEPEQGARPVDGLAYVCGIVAAGSLVLWRRWAVAMTAVVAMALLVYSARDYPGGPALLPAPLALIGLGYVASRRVAWLGAASVIAAVTVGRRIGGADLGAHELLVVGWAIAAVLAGQMLRARGERATAERERRAHLEDQALARERLRIAQDLHDSVAHAMATINVQSGVAAHLLDRRPEQARESLEAIRSASSDALDELGAILGVLRDRGEQVPRAPVAGLDRVGDLVDRATADGVSVRLAVTGEVAALAPSVSTAAYRVVQEALTNVRRHAGADASAVVRVDVTEGGALALSVGDDGGAPGRVTKRHGDTEPPSGAGFGLLGMRERVEATGGSLVVGPTGAGGYAVVAEWGPSR